MKQPPAARRPRTKLLAGFMVLALLALSPGVPAQDDVVAQVALLNRGLMELYQQGRYAEAALQAEALLALLEKELGPADPTLAAVLGNLATLYGLTGRFDAARPLYERALSIRESALGPDHPDVAGSLNNLAAHLRDTGDYEQAETLYRRALSIRERALGAEHLDVAQSLNNLAVLQVNQGRYQVAEPLLTRALSIREGALGREHLLVASTLNNLGGLYDAMGRTAEAEARYTRALGIRESLQGPDHPDVGQSLNNLAFLYDGQARYRKAEEFYLRALAVLSKAHGEAHPTVAGTLNNLATLYASMGRLAAAEEFHTRALGIRRSLLGEAHPDTAQSLNNLALLHDTQGRMQDAERLYLQALAAWEASLGPEHPDVAAALNNLAELRSAQGRFAEARPLYLRSLAIREGVYGLDHPDVATALNNLAGFYDAQSRHAQAEPLYQRSLFIMQGALGPEHPRVANVLNNLASVYESMDRLDEALQLHQRALEIREVAYGPEHMDVAASLNNMALLHSRAGRYEKALALNERAMQILSASLPADHPLLGTSFNNLAGLNHELQRLPLAQSQYQQALEIRERALGAEHRDVAITLNNLSALQADQGRTLQAMATIRRATGILARRADRSAARPVGSDLAEIRSNRFAFLRQVRIAHSLSVDLPDQRHALVAEAFEAGQRARASAAARAVASTAARFAAGDDALAELVRLRQALSDRWRRLEIAVIETTARPVAGRDPEAESLLRESLADARAGLEEVDRVLARSYPRYGEIAQPRPLPLAQVQALLAPDEALLSWLVGERDSFLWVLRKDRARLYALDLTESELARMVSRLRRRLDPSRQSGRRLRAFDSVLAHRLYQRALAPASEDLSGARHVFAIPDGALQSLPLGVLVTEAPAGPSPDPASVQWLTRRYATSVLPSVSSLRALREQAAPPRSPRPFIGIGNPRLDGDGGDLRGGVLYRGELMDPGTLRQLPALPDTEPELRAIALSLGSTDALLLGEAASERNVRAASLDSARVVAFATHALVAGEIPGLREPALVLTPPATASAVDDGLLGASEIARDLRLDAEWVVLSACNTAAGETPDADGLSGLAKAFFYAGTRALLVSHWPVESAAAARLTTRAFAIARDDPTLRRSEAVRRSMLELMDSAESPHHTHPMFWAPFVVVGEGGAAP